MDYNFTDQTRTVLARAREEAIRLHHDYIGTEHVLLGILRVPESAAAAILRRFSVDFDAVRNHLEGAVVIGRSMIALGELPYTSRAKKTLEFAMAESRELKHGHTGTEHLLLGLLREEKGIAAEVLNRVGVTLEGARRETLLYLGSSPEAAEKAVDPNRRFKEIVVVLLNNGELHRVVETRGPSAREFVENIGRRGVWITGRETFFVPMTAIARIQIYSPEEWASLGR